MYLKDTILQQQCRDLLTSEMKKLLQDNELEKQLIPDFSVGCKRVIPSGFRYLKVCPSLSLSQLALSRAN